MNSSEKARGVAVHEIHLNPDNRVNLTGRTRPDGTPIVRAETVIVKPGFPFEIDAEALAGLVASGAAIPADDAEAVTGLRRYLGVTAGGGDLAG